ncbi:Rrf2 family transcriptional regulator [Aequorivita sp. F47161]|jgi:Rrf2 family protein|uniref:Rrf2 family transcriptional regulator n=1 Tax=Aequorivita vitellina TaxID=2874475 RepID=A0A9X1U1R9_9FLAO|nr:Rrf2 family transcriptional regulator [Aequorivita vitellina]MCG2419150.1 Rrf2 family transcriptional regulator [Aequorivita vitellina]MCZ4319116.1 Rrf2 family transcriptional regulator [Aequorivita viscosa]
MFSKACEYGIRAVLFIAKQSQKDLRPNITEIAKAVDSPEPFTAKVCQQLARAGIILSKKGPNGGFYLEKDSKLKLAEIVATIDGDNIFEGCSLGLSECSSEHPCPVHDQFMDVRNGLKNMCENTLVVDLAKNLEEGETFLKI